MQNGDARVHARSRANHSAPPRRWTGYLEVVGTLRCHLQSLLVTASDSAPDPGTARSDTRALPGRGSSRDSPDSRAFGAMLQPIGTCRNKYYLVADCSGSQVAGLIASIRWNLLLVMFGTHLALNVEYESEKPKLTHWS